MVISTKNIDMPDLQDRLHASPGIILAIINDSPENWSDIPPLLPAGWKPNESKARGNAPGTVVVLRLRPEGAKASFL